MGGKKTPKAYVPENLEFLAKSLVQISGAKNEGKEYVIVNITELEKAIKKLPRKDKEKIERFWGLTGGVNHSKKLVSFNSKDKAFLTMCNEAIISLRILFRLDYMSMYNENLRNMIDYLARKINKGGMNVSDLDAIKYLIVFLVIFQNGPKMSFENDPLTIDSECSEDFTFDEYSIIKGAFNEFKNIPDKSINLKLICNMLDMLDFKDTLIVKKTFSISIPKDEILDGYQDVEIEEMSTLAQVRNFKERIFPYGAWEIVNELILGNLKGEIKLEEFMKHLDKIRKDWSEIAKFKVGNTKLRTPHELRTLYVYNIGGLEFTDIYEVMFLYLERNIIAPGD